MNYVLRISDVIETTEKYLANHNIKYESRRYYSSYYVRIYPINYEVYEDIAMNITDKKVIITVIPNNLHELSWAINLFEKVRINLLNKANKLNTTQVEFIDNKLQLTQTAYSIKDISLCLTELLQTIDKLKAMELEFVEYALS
jgi:hypothetical protein